jgi:hypothetical protein
VPIDVALQVAAVVETVTVSGQSPTVDTTSANVAVNLSEDLIQGTPGGRDILPTSFPTSTWPRVVRS